MNAHVRSHSTASHMQWGLLAPATVLLGGAGLLAFAGGAEISGELGLPGRLWRRSRLALACWRSSCCFTC